MGGTPFQNQQRRLTRDRDAASPGATVDFIFTGQDYFAVMDVPLLVGRAFERDRGDDLLPGNAQGRPRSLVLDRAAAQTLGWPEPAGALGATVYAPGGVAHEIVGVVERTPASVRANGASGTAYVFAPTPVTASYWIVRMANDRVAASLAHIDAAVKSLRRITRLWARLFFDRFFEAAYWTFDRRTES